MKLQIFKTLPKELVVAVSGGVDSVTALQYFLNRGFKVSIAHYVHASDNALEEYEFVKQLAADLSVDLHLDFQKDLPEKVSKEAFWRQGRYSFFQKFDLPVVVAHTLDDAVEWYLYSVMNGQMSFMEYSNRNVVRPFLLQKKEAILDYAARYNLNWYHDETNDNEDFAKRNKVRHSLIPIALEINPGIYNMVKRRIFEKEFRK